MLDLKKTIYTHMKTILYIVASLLLIFKVHELPAQEIIKVKHSCSFDKDEKSGEFYAFESSSEADLIVGQIVDAFSLSKNFIVKSANCKNAMATVEGKQRYILYNTTFLENFKNESKTKWAAYCVLAHEIGHHLNNHDFEVKDSRKRKLMELEADKFAGGVLYILGATLEESKAGIELLQLKGESDTHPPANARAEAIANGWKNSQEQYKNRRVSPNSSPSTSSEFITDKRSVQDYKTIHLADRVWLAENLNLNILDSWCYGNEAVNCEKYGRLYSFEAARKACESLGSGWRLPTKMDWNRLFKEHSNVTLMKGGLSGFDLIKAGELDYTNNDFDYLDQYGYYWSDNRGVLDHGKYYRFTGRNAKNELRSNKSHQRDGRSCRCVKDKK